MTQSLAELLAAHPETPLRRRWSPPHRCPVHDQPLLTAIGVRFTADITPTRAFEAIQIANPCCLDVDEAFEPGRVALSHAPARLVWCPACQAAATRR
ncbi:hypothetical protein ACNOYE_08895 [Nannocystaceae bacterium ST9]